MNAFERFLMQWTPLLAALASGWMLGTAFADHAWWRLPVGLLLLVGVVLEHKERGL